MITLERHDIHDIYFLAKVPCLRVGQETTDIFLRTETFSRAKRKDIHT